jgi:hypothetical protein
MRKYYTFLILSGFLILLGASCSLSKNNTSSQYVESKDKIEIPVDKDKILSVSNLAGFAYDKGRGLEQCDELLNSTAVRFYNYCVSQVAIIKGDINICKLQTTRGEGFDNNLPELDKQKWVERSTKECIRNVYTYAAQNKNYSLLGLCSKQDNILEKASCYRNFRDGELDKPCTEKYNSDNSADAQAKWIACAKVNDTICPKINEAEERALCENAYNSEMYKAPEQP